MGSNAEFLEVLKKSFVEYLNTGARSNAKLKILHSYITEDLYKKLKSKKFSFYSLGFQKGKETCIKGRYFDKKVDITIKNTESEEDVAGLGVKFVMSNYSQNSNNYFESMLGETSNIRCNNIPYFQVFCIFDLLPYYDKNGNIKKWEQISEHHIKKYLNLSQDNTDLFYHTPNKTLLYVVHVNPEITQTVKTKSEYKEYYKNNSFILTSSDRHFNFGRAIIYNNYEEFIKKVVYTIKSR